MFWMIVGGILGGGFLLLVGRFIMEVIKLEYYEKHGRSEAYLEGYKDMAKAHQVCMTKRVWNNRGPYGSQINEDVSVIEEDKYKNPTIPLEYLRPAATYLMEGKFEINPKKGQTDKRYLGGTDEEFKDYYQGGMKFIEHLDQAREAVLQEIENKKRKENLIEIRRQGLEEVNRKVVTDLSELNKLRDRALSGENWDQMMKEIENAN